MTPQVATDAASAPAAGLKRKEADTKVLVESNGAPPFQPLTAVRSPSRLAPWLSLLPPGTELLKAPRARTTKTGDGAAQEERPGPLPAKRAKAEPGRYAEPRATRGGDQLVVPKAEATPVSEEEALAATGGGAGVRRVTDFKVTDSEGRLQAVLTPAGTVPSFPLFLSGHVAAETGPLVGKAGAKGPSVVSLPLTKVVLGDVSAPGDVVFLTAAASYVAAKPASAYKALFEPCAAASRHAHEVVAALTGPEGQPGLELKEVAARVARARGVPLSVAKGYLIRDGPHILATLASLDGASDPKGKGKATRPPLGQLPFAVQLRAELAAAASAAAAPTHAPSNGIVFRPTDAPAASAAAPEGESVPTSTSEAQLYADAALARALAESERARDVSKAKKAVARAAASAAGTEAYLKIHESEFRDEYPVPTEYVKEEEEMDELLLGDMDDDDVIINPYDLPRRTLTDFAIYKDDGLMDTLELIPMWAGVDPDVELFASGIVADDNGDFTEGGFSVDGAAQGGAAASSSSAPAQPQGLRVYLSAVKEWILECGADVLCVSLRTDSAWYRLIKPAAAYADWYAPLLKACRMAAKALALVAAEERAARLTLDGLVKKLAEEPEASACHVGSKPSDVDKYLSAHGAILLAQFRNYPVPAVKKSSIPGALRERMALRRHTSLAVPKKGKSTGFRRTGLNLNPVRSQKARAKPMPATTTVLVHRVWAATVAAAEAEAAALAAEEAAAAAAAEAAAEAAAAAKDTGAGEDEDEEEEEAVKPKKKASKPGRKAKTHRTGVPAPQGPAVTFSWADAGDRAADGTITHTALLLDTVTVRHGDCVWVTEQREEESEEEASDSESDEPREKKAKVESVPMRHPGLVMKLWEDEDGDSWALVRLFAFGTDTVLRSAASARELFLTPAVVTVALNALAPGPETRRLDRPWGFAHRAAAEAEDAAAAEEAAKRAEQGLPPQYIWRRMWIASQGAFTDVPSDVLDPEAHAAAEAASEAGRVTCVLPDKGLQHEGVRYAVGDYMYVLPDSFPELKPLEAVKKHETPEYLKEGRAQKGACQHLRAFGVGRLLSVKTGKDKKPVSVTLRRCVRPEELGPSHGYAASRWAIYDSDITVEVELDSIVGACLVLPPGHAEGDNTFVVSGFWDKEARAVQPAPADFPLAPAAASAAAAASPAASGPAPPPLATLDIFAGCGGLSEGMRQAGAAVSRWAIEYEPDAAEAFRQNHPGCHVFNANCNALLRRCISKAGMPDSEARASPEAEEQAAAMAQAEMDALPLPGQVDFICGGPPCQGFSGMNRFTAKGSLWSRVQNEMILSYLSYADLYRPKYFLLENVRNFVAFNKGLTFRTALRTLLEMGYQVRFGVLNAAFYGVGQSRKRAFLIAAAPGERLPEWPLPQTCFNSPQLTFELPCGTRFCAVPQRTSAPLRAVTVRDMIGDLPAVPNGAEEDDLAYDKPPVSAFQKDIRAGAERLRNHVCKVLNEVNERRCSLIPKESNHDWRYLKQLTDSGAQPEHYQSATMAKPAPLVPVCLPNSAERHNGWRGLYSRLDWDGHFSTSTTDPNPMGKVGQVFHPAQDRIVSVRECARSQGFPDTFTFWGAVSSKHRQVGNAVPPPLAAALGRELRKAVLATHAQKA